MAIAGDQPLLREWKFAWVEPVTQPDHSRKLMDPGNVLDCVDACWQVHGPVRSVPVVRKDNKKSSAKLLAKLL